MPKTVLAKSCNCRRNAHISESGFAGGTGYLEGGTLPFFPANSTLPQPSLTAPGDSTLPQPSL
ncbi:MAG: hypothetical protein L0922_06820, partial [Candidatus Mariimomonas ferrooxydans]